MVRCRRARHRTAFRASVPAHSMERAGSPKRKCSLHQGCDKEGLQGLVLPLKPPLEGVWLRRSSQVPGSPTEWGNAKGRPRNRSPSRVTAASSQWKGRQHVKHRWHGPPTTITRAWADRYSSPFPGLATDLTSKALAPFRRCAPPGCPQHGAEDAAGRWKTRVARAAPSFLAERSETICG